MILEEIKMARQYLLHYVTNKQRNSKILSKHKFVESRFDVQVFASSRVEAVRLARREIMNSICYSGIDNFTLCNISVIE